MWFGRMYCVLHERQERSFVEHTALTAHGVLGECEGAVGSGPAWSMLRVPVAGAYRVPVAIVVVILTRQHQRDQDVRICHRATDDDEGAILAL